MSDHSLDGRAEPPFLGGDGEMAARIRDFDWASSTLGKVQDWPGALRTTLRILLSTNHPVFLFWGPHAVCFYNDAYRPSLGPEKHPSMLGAHGRTAWAEAWPVIGPQIESVMAGAGATWHENQPVPIIRHGRLEQAYWTYSYGPVDDDSAPGGIGGVLVLCTETTKQVLAAERSHEEQQRWLALFDQSPGFICVLTGPEHRFAYTNRRYLELVVQRAEIGRSVEECLPEVRQQGFVGLLDAVYSSGQPHVASAAPVHLQSAPGAPPRLRYLDFIYQPVRNEAGQVTGIFVEGHDVTERTLAAQAVDASEQRARERAEELEAVMRSVQACIWIAHDRDCARITGNPQSYRLIGMPEGENTSATGPAAAQRCFSEFIGGQPADPQMLPLQRAARTGEIVPPMELSFRFDDGRWCHLYGGAAPLYDKVGQVRGAVAAFIDVSEMLRAQALLAQRERELRTVADNTPDILARFDRQYRQVFISAAVERATGRTPAELLGRHVSELDMPETQRAQWQRALDEVFASGQPAQFEYDIVNPVAQEQRTYVARLVPEFGADADAGPAATHVLAIVQDVSERRRAEDAVRDATRRKDEFLATLAHELRNPLAPLRSGLQILQREAAGQEAARVCTMMNRQLSQMVRLIDDLLDVSRISAGKMTLRPEAVSLQAVAELALEATRPALDAARHRLELELAAEPVWVRADVTRLAQVIGNLLNNAAKYTPDGGRIGLEVAREGSQAVLRVADSGVGIAPAMHAEVFRMFAQVDRTLHRTQGGLGVGLALARSIVELHDGTVQAESEGLDRGSVFTIRLPLLQPSPAHAPPPPAASPAGPRGAGPAVRRGLRVLVVDDNFDAADSLVLLLGLSGHEARAAYDGEAGLRLALSWCPDVAFLDIGLPGLDGYELAARLRAQAGARQPLLVALTGWSAAPDAQRSRDAGFDLHYTKPVAIEAVEAVLANVLAQRRPC